MGNYFFANSKPTIKVLLLGLDAAGKTTFMYKMSRSEIETQIPTIGFNTETCTIDNLKITCWDVGGRSKIYALWRHFYKGTNCVVFVIDSNDRERIMEVKEEMCRVLNAEELQDCSVLILANKQDLPNAMSLAEITAKLEFEKCIKQKNWNLMGTVATTGEGLKGAVSWIQKLNENVSQ